MPRPRPKPKKRRRKRGFSRGGAIADHYAHHVVEVALRSGQLVRPDRCETCRKIPPRLANGASAIQAHHDDYNAPMRVRWLCKGCHFLWHRHHVAVPRRSDPEPDPGEKPRKRRAGARGAGLRSRGDKDLLASA